MRNKLITILIVLILQSCSCITGYETPKNYMIVGDIKSKSDYCLYISNSGKRTTKDNLLGNWYAAIADTCGKWNVGDTIRFR